MEDSVKAWLTMVDDRWEHGDSAALLDTYLPTGSLVSATDGQIMTSRDSAAQFLTGLSQMTDAKATYGDAKIGVLAPGVAAVTVPYDFQGKNQGKQFEFRGVYSAVLAERDGRLRIVQEHQSNVRQPTKKKGT